MVRVANETQAAVVCVSIAEIGPERVPETRSKLATSINQKESATVVLSLKDPLIFAVKSAR